MTQAHSAIHPAGARESAAAATLRQWLRDAGGAADAGTEKAGGSSGASCCSSGAPLSEAQLRELPLLIRQCSPAELAAIAGAVPPVPALPLPPPGAPPLWLSMPLAERLAAAQRVISSLKYNHTPRATYCDTLSKQRPFSAVMATARAALSDAMPIKCVEAAFIALLLTCGWRDCERAPLSFKTRGADGQSYRHIVVAVREAAAGGNWGALGLSRRAELMYKPLGAAAALSGLVADYAAAYAAWGHRLERVRVGLPAPHDAAFAGRACWRYVSIDVPKRGWPWAAARLDKHAAQMGELAGAFAEAAAAAAAAVGTPRRSTAAAGVAVQPGQRGAAKQPPASRGSSSSSSSSPGRTASAVAPPPPPPPCGGVGSGRSSSSDDIDADSVQDEVVKVLRSPRRHGG